MALLLSLGLSLDSSALPPWAWGIIRMLDDSMSDDCKEDVLIEGMVLFTKFS
ncbi:hypothetical protein [Pseudomonas sp. B33.4]|uniref:hypothetical protein n=1 Tax=Pseudomonas sp. B33.4 TaxID=3104265 RepID=UPI002ADEB8CA|nr:hypothetical protein [Pseudomonas sp. B33.4]